MKRPSKQKARKPLSEMERLSTLHTAIGLQITLSRGDKSVTAMAHELGISTYVLRSMEYGVHDYTLSQLQKLSEVLGIDLAQLVKR